MSTVAFKAGMHLLETLTSGMYNDPLSIYREYIQNAVDSIDQSGGPETNSVIAITLNPFKKIITIFDNGFGIPSDIAEKILSSIGSSEKFGTSFRGFRGIGRLGGIAFAKKVSYKTKAKGESIVSTQEWDCEKFRYLLASLNHSTMSIEELFSEVTHFKQSFEENPINDSFFEVTLNDAESFRNYILDIQKIKRYLMQVAPLPFNSNHFTFSDDIQKYLIQNLPQYFEYNITLNNEQLLRPYRDDLLITSHQNIDFLESVEMFSLKHNDICLAHGWYGRRKDFLGSIRKGEGVSGIRVRVGNIQVGDQHLLDRCFRESRFNSYVVGEIHVCNSSLIPNSRRDDFVDNKEKAIFYNLIERQLGLPLSKEIRQCSRTNTKIEPAKQNHDQISADLSSLNLENCNSVSAEITLSGTEPTASNELLNKILDKCGDCHKLKTILDQSLN